MTKEWCAILLFGMKMLRSMNDLFGGGNTDRYPRSVQVFKSDKQKSKLHSTQKPIALLEYFIKTYTNPGDIVLDNACGSGGVGEACKNTARNFIMIEKDLKSYNIARERVFK